MDYFRSISKLLVTFLIIFFSIGSPVFSLTAYQIMQKVDERYTGETVEQTSTLVLIDKKNRKRERILKGFSKDFGKPSYLFLRIFFLLDGIN